MLSPYPFACLQLLGAVPQLGSDIASRAAELLRAFNNGTSAQVSMGVYAGCGPAHITSSMHDDVCLYVQHVLAVRTCFEELMAKRLIGLQHKPCC